MVEKGFNIELFFKLLALKIQGLQMEKQKNEFKTPFTNPAETPPLPEPLLATCQWSQSMCAGCSLSQPGHCLQCWWEYLRGARDGSIDGCPCQ